MEKLRFWLNDAPIEVADAAPTTTLLRHLRDDLRLVGTKEGCAEGDCGACTVAIVEPGAGGAPAFRAQCSCLLFLPMLHQKRVYTVEGLPSPATTPKASTTPCGARASGGEPHLVQRALTNALGSQCGYCTPGVTMALFEACYREDLDEAWKLDAALAGNLCRCTGYRPIRAAAQAVAGAAPEDRFAQILTLEPEPPEALEYRTKRQAYLRPVTFEGLFAALDAEPAARLIAGGTDLALEVTKKYAEPEVLVGLDGISDLQRLCETPDGAGWRLGAAATLTALEAFARFSMPSLERMLRYFGSRQIKNRATLGGNLATASPIGDLAPVFASLGAVLVLRSRAGERRLPIEEFFLDYRRTALAPREIVACIDVPKPEAGARCSSYKVSKRRELDISTVAAGFFVVVGEDGRVAKARLAYGGMAPTPARARKTEAALIGAPWTIEQVARAAEHLDEDFAPISDHRGSSWYRARVAQNLLRGFFLETAETHAPRLPARHAGTVVVD